MQYRWTLFLLLLAPVLGSAQIMFPGGGVGVTPPWMRGRKTITGHIGDIDGTKVMVKTLDAGNVLFTVDDKTKIHIDKTKLALADLKVEDAVMVELKELKDKSQYATEIVPHPDVLARKQRRRSGPFCISTARKPEDAKGLWPAPQIGRAHV